MKLYRVQSGILIEDEGKFFLHKENNWDAFINDDNLYSKAKALTLSLQSISNAADILRSEILPPVQNQELWACGVTYFRSKVGRQEESKDAGGGDFYGKVYEAVR